METEYRLICAKYGKDRGHRSHAYRKSAKEKAEKGRLDANRHTAKLINDKTPEERGRAGDYYSGEAPWVVQSREIGEWEDVTGE